MTWLLLALVCASGAVVLSLLWLLTRTARGYDGIPPVSRAWLDSHAHGSGRAR